MQGRVVLRPEPTDTAGSRIRGQPKPFVGFNRARAAARGRRGLKYPGAACIQPPGGTLKRPPRAQAPHDRNVEYVAPQFLLRLAEGEGDVKVVADRQSEELGRCDANDFHEFPVHQEGAASAEFTPTHDGLPIGVTHNGSRRRARALVLRQDHPPAPGLHAEHAEELPANPYCGKPTRFASLAHIDPVGSPGKNS